MLTSKEPTSKKEILKLYETMESFLTIAQYLEWNDIDNAREHINKQIDKINMEIFKLKERGGKDGNWAFRMEQSS